MIQVKCMKPLMVQKYDDNGFPIENDFVLVEEQSIWDVAEDKWKLIGGEIRLEDNNIWIEISKETYKKYFQPIF